MKSLFPASGKTPPKALEKRAKSNYCGSCYGAESESRQCCSTCEDVRGAYQAKGWVLSDLSAIEQCRDEGLPAMMASAEKEGCRFNGTVTVEKVIGGFHFAPGRSYQAGGGNVHVHDIASLSQKIVSWFSSPLFFFFLPIPLLHVEEV